MLLFGGILAAQTNGNDLKRHTRFFKSYMHETFPDFKIRDGEYLFVLPTEDAKKLCSDDCSKGPSWMMMWTLTVTIAKW